VVIEPLLDEGVDRLERGFVDRLERDDKVDQVTILLPDTSVVLPVTLVLDPFKLRLEVESIAHLIEQEGEEEIAPIAVEGHESGVFIRIDIISEVVTAGQRVCDRSEDGARGVQVGKEKRLVNALFHLLIVQGSVVRIVGPAIDCIDTIIDAEVCVDAVCVGEFHTNDERVHLEEVLSGGEGLLGHPVVVLVGLAYDGSRGLMCDAVELFLILLTQLLKGFIIVEGTTLAGMG